MASLDLNMVSDSLITYNPCEHATRFQSCGAVKTCSHSPRSALRTNSAKNGLRRVVKTCSHSMIVMIERNSPPFARTRRSKSAICIAEKFRKKWFAPRSKDLFSLNDRND